MNDNKIIDKILHNKIIGDPIKDNNYYPNISIYLYNKSMSIVTMDTKIAPYFFITDTREHEIDTLIKDTVDAAGAGAGARARAGAGAGAGAGVAVAAVAAVDKYQIYRTEQSAPTNQNNERQTNINSQLQPIDLEKYERSLPNFDDAMPRAAPVPNPPAREKSLFIQYLQKITVLLNNKKYKTIVIYVKNKQDLCDIIIYKTICTLVDIINDYSKISIKLSDDIYLLNGKPTDKFSKIDFCESNNLQCISGYTFNSSKDIEKEIMSLITLTQSFIKLGGFDKLYKFLADNSVLLTDYLYFLLNIISEKNKIEIQYTVNFITHLMPRIKNMPSNKYIVDYFEKALDILTQYKDSITGVEHHAAVDAADSAVDVDAMDMSRARASSDSGHARVIHRVGDGNFVAEEHKEGHDP